VEDLMAYAELLCEAALINGEGLAFAAEGGKRSWAEVRELTARVASGLSIEFSLKQGARVAVLMGVGQDQALLSFALSWLGVTIVPVNTRLSVADIKAVVKHADVALLFWDTANEACALELIESKAVSPGAAVDAELLADLARGAGRARADWSDTDIAALVFTGGTTGAPKGVMLPHAMARAMARTFAAEMGYDPGTVYLSALPLFHVAGLGQLLGVTLGGGCHVFGSVGGPTAIYDALRDAGVNTIVAVPTMLAMLLEPAVRDDRLLAQIRAVGYGGAAIPLPLLERLVQAMPNAGFRQFYGQTETGGLGTALRPEFHVVAGPAAGRLSTCGQLCTGYEVATCDADGVPTATGVPGEIVMRSAFLTPGYWRDSRRTEELYRGEWLRTGDVGVIDAAGFLSVVDRLKDMIITGGENVYCTEVENVIARHPDVVACAVVGLPDERWGEAVHAVVVKREGSSVNEAQLMRFCAETLAHFKRPKSIEISTDPLPLSGVGKVMKTILRDRYMARRQANPAHLEN
jgi:long-chain acyl-CoA synthetase